MADPLERLTNLVALLMETRTPLTFEEIVHELHGQYPDKLAARRAAFEREKRELRALGIPLTTEVFSGERAGQTGYRINRADFELGDLGLTDDERDALQLAVATVRLGSGWGDAALIKIGSTATSDSGLSALLLAPDVIPSLFDAVNRRCVVRFTYHGKPRELEPWGLLSRTGFWYLVGRDRAVGEQRVYRVDRIEGGIALGPADQFERPDGFDLRQAMPEDTKLLGEAAGATNALVLISTERARAAVLELGEAAVVERRDDGSVVLDVPCVNPLAFRSWVLGFVEHAEVLAPPEVRGEIASWLAGMVDAGVKRG